VFAIDIALSRIPKGLSVVACAVLVVAAAVYGLMRRGGARLIALAGAGLLMVTSIALVSVGHDPRDAVVIADRPRYAHRWTRFRTR